MDRPARPPRRRGVYKKRAGQRHEGTASSLRVEAGFAVAAAHGAQQDGNGDGDGDNGNDGDGDNRNDDDGDITGSDSQEEEDEDDYSVREARALSRLTALVGADERRRRNEAAALAAKVVQLEAAWKEDHEFPEDGIVNIVTFKVKVVDWEGDYELQLAHAGQLTYYAFYRIGLHLATDTTVRPVAAAPQP